MPNVYGFVTDLQNDASSSVSANAAAHLRNLIAATAEVDDRTLRSFAARLVTQVFDVPAPNRANNFGTRLWLPFDIASITTLKEKTAEPLTFGTTLTENTNFIAYREDGDANKTMVYLDRLDGGSWPSGPGTLQFIGYRGYSYEVEDTGQTVQNASEISASDTSLLVTSSAGLCAGQMLKIDSEQCYISAIPDATHATIERAQNGTVAATHANGTAIYRRRYPREIETATVIRAMDLFQGKRTGFQGAQGGEDVGFGSNLAYRQFVGLLGPWKRTVV